MTDASTIEIDPELRRAREQTIQDLIEVENTVDLDRLGEVFTHPRYELIGINRVYDGLDECRRHLKERAAAFPDYHIDPITYHHADEAVIAEVWITGTHMGRIESIDPSGKGFRCRMAAFFLFEGQQLTCERLYFDHATIARQLA